MIEAHAAHGDGLVRVIDCGHGAYRGTYTAVLAGIQLLHVRLSGEPINQSPFRVHVVAGPACAAASVVRGDGARVGTAGRRETFVVDVYDRWGNSASAEEGELKVELWPCKVTLPRVELTSNHELM